MVRVLHLSDLHLGSGLSYGQINPVSGLNSRLEDFTHALENCIDYALKQQVDLVLFGGDAFPDATPPPLHQDLFAAQFCRLAAAQIPTVLLVGNHDQYGQGHEGSSLSIYRTLEVQGFEVGDKLQTLRLQTRSGPVQVTTLPWLLRSTLLTREETMGLDTDTISAQLLQRLHLVLQAEIRRLDPTVPAILLAHAMVDTARVGSERHLAVGKGFTIPLALLAQPAFQYVALGHVHRHQVLCQQPLMLYPGSLERVDFGEEEETKGFVIADVHLQGASFQFIPIAARPFCTLRIDVSHLPPQDPQLQQQIHDLIQQSPIEDAVVRLIYRLRPEQLQELDENLLHTQLAPAHFYTVTPEVTSPPRARLPGLDPDTLEPLQALEQYLQTRPELESLQADLLTTARQVLEDLHTPESEWMWPEEPLEPGEEPEYQEQLRLL